MANEHTQSSEPAVQGNHPLLLKANSKSLRQERRGKVLTSCGAFAIIALTIALIIFISSKGFSTFVVNKISISEFLTGTEWSGNEGKYGAFNFIFGSLTVSLLAACTAAPLGIGAAVFSTEIAPKWGRKIIQPAVEILGGIPSVVYGFIGLSVVVPFIRHNFGGTGFSLLAGVIVLTVMILPTVTSLSTDALSAIPRGLREASYALGATRWQTIYRTLLPAALPGLLTAIVLGLARAFGEALAVQMVIGNSKAFPQSLVDTAHTLTSILTLEVGHTIPGSAYNNALWSMAFILLLVTLLLVLLIRFLAKRRNV